LPISALKGTNLEQLENAILPLLPEGELIYPEDQVTDRPERFLCAEVVREKLTRRLGDELPYSLTVEVERYEELPNITKIFIVIWVERPSQKSIVIGTEGAMLKKIGTDARGDIEKLINQKAFLKLWVKVKKGWSDNERALLSLGFNE
jgi:GTPase